jgi:hypothetical protein
LNTKVGSSKINGEGVEVGGKGAKKNRPQLPVRVLKWIGKGRKRIGPDYPFELD